MFGPQLVASESQHDPPHINRPDEVDEGESKHTPELGDLPIKHDAHMQSLQDSGQQIMLQLVATLLDVLFQFGVVVVLGVGFELLD